ncbi:MAG: DoxX family protein [Pseudomonadota bacterium]
MRHNARIASGTRGVLGLLGWSVTAPAQAHVRWFTDPNAPELASFPAYSWSDPEVLVWSAIALVLIVASVLLDSRLPSPPIVRSKIRHDAIELLRICTGMSFVLTAYGGELLAPHLSAYGGFGAFLLFLQAFIGILLISNNLMYHAALLTGLLYLGAVVQFGLVPALEYISVLGIAVFLFCNHAPEPALRDRLKPYSVAILRIFTGLAFIALGINEKLIGFALGQSFMGQYPWNFMPAVGFSWFDDQLFVLSAGVIEVVFGVILVLGTTTRVNVLVLSLVMLTSNIVFLLQREQENALIELVGHMPIMATAVILLLLGYGQRLKFRLPGRRPGAVSTAVAA